MMEKFEEKYEYTMFLQWTDNFACEVFEPTVRSEAKGSHLKYIIFSLHLRICGRTFVPAPPDC